MRESSTTVRERSTVLVVDDDSSFLRALGRLLGSIGFEAQTFEQPTHLLKFPMPETNACLLLDVHMPEINGIELYEMLAAAGPTPPVIMMTGRNDSDTRQLLRRTNAVAVLNKPFDEALLVQAIFRALASQRGPDGHN